MTKTPQDGKKTGHSFAPNCPPPAQCGQTRHGLRGLEDLKNHLAAAADFRISRGRPFVVLSYAQSVDGSIAGPQRQRIHLSGPESMRLTHTIRSLCDTILVGIGTLLADNPRLSVKRAPGRSPQPIVLDTRLRTPENARLVQRPDVRPWLVHGPEALPSRARALMAAGADPVPCASASDGRIHLGALMRWLSDHAINSLMVEGGARVITSFIRDKLADVIVITISPRMLGGLPVIETNASEGGLDLQLDGAFYERLGRDLILWARPGWTAA